MRVFFIYTLVFFLGIKGFSQEIPSRPHPPRLVNDFANLLSPSERDGLEAKLVNFNDSTGTQIALVIVTDLMGYDKADFSYRIGEQWKVGQAGFNNGVVVLIKPKQANSKGEAFIATGYGLEGVIPDLTARMIIEREMIPSFKQERYFEGINNALNAIQALAVREFSAADYQAKSKSKREKGGTLSLLVVLLILVVLFVLMNRSKKSYTMGRKPGLLEMLWLISQTSGRHGGKYSDFSSGKGSFGGSGGFGGFGGGSFGGGGAGGEW